MVYITLYYLFIAACKQVYFVELGNYTYIFGNLLITELVYYFTSYYYTFPEKASTLNLIAMFLAQDVYFYFVHWLFHSTSLYRFHAKHHESLSPLEAWYAHPIDHFIINIGSFAVPFLLFPNSLFILKVLIAVQIYTSVNGHTKNSKHSVHHRNPKKRFGSLYLCDWLFDTY